MNSDWHGEFLILLPAIGRYARGAFSGMPAESRDEAVQEVVALALASYLRLQSRGRTGVAYASTLARYAISRVREGRQFVGTARRDVLSRHRQPERVSLGTGWSKQGCARCDWQEILVEDRRATPADIAASRIDFAGWLQSLPPVKRQAALVLAGGASTREAADELQLSAGRISQLRRSLHADWHAYIGSCETECGKIA